MPFGSSHFSRPPSADQPLVQPTPWRRLSGIFHRLYQRLRPAPSLNVQGTLLTAPISGSSTHTGILLSPGPLPQLSGSIVRPDAQERELYSGGLVQVPPTDADHRYDALRILSERQQFDSVAPLRVVNHIAPMPDGMHLTRDDGSGALRLELNGPPNYPASPEIAPLTVVTPGNSQLIWTRESLDAMQARNEDIVRRVTPELIPLADVSPLRAHVNRVRQDMSALEAEWAAQGFIGARPTPDPQSPAGVRSAGDDAITRRNGELLQQNPMGEIISGHIHQGPRMGFVAGSMIDGAQVGESMRQAEAADRMLGLAMEGTSVYFDTERSELRAQPVVDGIPITSQDSVIGYGAEGQQLRVNRNGRIYLMGDQHIAALQQAQMAEYTRLMSMGELTVRMEGDTVHMGFDVRSVGPKLPPKSKFDFLSGAA